MSLDREFLKCSEDKLEQLLNRIESCVDRLTLDQVWTRGAESQNAIGNLILHLAGNVRQWILFGVGGQPDHRNRDWEFANRGGIPLDDLKHRLRSTVEEAVGLLKGLSETQLLETTSVQDYHNISKLQAIFHVVEHFSMHTGQIIFMTKALTGEDLGFYRHLQDKSHGETVP
jgi:uncharacterized damage-inducible protein DinB